MNTTVHMRALSRITLLSALAAVTLPSSCTTTNSKTVGPEDSGPSDQCSSHCGGSGGYSGSGNGRAGASGSGGREAGNNDAPPVVCDPQPIPPDVPEGWEEYPIMDCKFRLYVPSSREYLPPPLTWEPCSSLSGRLPYDCRQIQMDWQNELVPPPYAIGGEAYAYVEPDGRVVIQLRKVYERSGKGEPIAFMGIVVEADGAVRQAIWQDYGPSTNRSLWFGQFSIAPGKSSWNASDMTAGTASLRRVSLGGDDTLLRPSVLFDYPEKDPESGLAVVGSHFYFKTGSRYRVFKWDGTDMGAPASGGGAFSPPSWVGSTLLFALESFPYYSVLRWTEQDGTRVLVGFGNDDSKGAGQPGSDGKDLVWTQGENLGYYDDMFPDKWIMTSKFSVNPARIMPRRLMRWRPKDIGTFNQPPPVGCGYAAFGYFYDDIPKNQGVLIVRLSDGVSWLLPDVSLSGPPDAWGVPIAITCDEVFAMYHASHLPTIRRVRLDSLGPGTPPSL